MLSGGTYNIQFCLNLRVMCGISGFCDFTSSSDVSVLQEMTDILYHRGPDDSGYKFISTAYASVGMGHRRLSILDLTDNGHQPMTYKHLTIVFNGEIYNFLEIRRELQELGYNFQSNCDTEVLLKGFFEWGLDILHRCIGMFAIALFDSESNKMYLIRDRVGVKPLYYYWDDKAFLFSSEIKSFYCHPLFKKDIDISSLGLFLQYSYIPGPYSIFKSTYKLLPGHILVLDLANRKIKLDCYWDVNTFYQKPSLRLNYNHILDHTEELLISSYKYRMVSDVPVGVFLSGGYDSVSVASILQYHTNSRIKTFTIGFYEDEFNEANDAKNIANYLGTEHYEYYASDKDVEYLLDKISLVYDEPFADNSVIPTILVSQFASQEVKVVLSADGGDEIFGGYRKFNQAIHYTHDFPRWMQLFASHVMNMINPDVLPIFSRQYNFSTRFKKISRIWESGEPKNALKVIAQYIPDFEVEMMLKYKVSPYQTFFDVNGYQANDLINTLLSIDYKTFLVDNNLVKVDRATMSVSIEGREPLLDHRLIEWLAQLPGTWKIRGNTNKYLLKQIVHKYIPENLMDRPKKPFIAPLNIWFKDKLSDLLMYYLSEDMLDRSGFFNSDYVIALRDSYLSGRKVNFQKIWQILIFQLWYSKWMM